MWLWKHLSWSHKQQVVFRSLPLFLAPPFLPPLSPSFGFSCPDPLIKIFSILYLLQVAPELL